MRFLFAAIGRNAVDHPDRLALVDDQGTRIPYAALPLIIDSVALHAFEAGLEPGQTVAVATPASSNIGLLVALGMLRAGMTIATATADQLRSAGILPDATLALKIPDQLGPSRVIAVGPHWMTHPDASSASPARLSAVPVRTPVAVISTSLGDDKIIAMGTEAVRAKITEKGLSDFATHSWMSLFSPLSITGLSIDYGVFYRGKTLIRFGRDAIKYRHIFKNRNIEALYATQNDIERLIEFGERYDLNSINNVQVLLTEGRTFHRTICERATKILSKNLYFSYAPTELFRVTMSKIDDIPDIPGAVGKLDSRSMVDIVDDRGFAVPLGKMGQIRIGVPAEYSALGYVESGKLTPFPTDYVYCGDRGAMNDDNQLVLERGIS